MVVIPYADQLTFRTDQTRYRRDHATYLSLIASLALLHQYQREQVNHEGQLCVLAALEDVRWANELATGTLGARRAELLLRTRRLLRQLDHYVRASAARDQLRPEEVRFTQRELRETLHWQDRALRRQLQRLVQLEYVVAHRTGRGNQRAFQLLYGPDLAAWSLGLREFAPADHEAADTPLTVPRTGDSPTPRQPTDRREPVTNRHSEPAAARRGSDSR